MSPPPPTTTSSTPHKSLRSSIPSFIPTSQVVKLQSGMNKLRDIFTPTQSTTNLADTKKSTSNGYAPTGKFTTAKDATTLFPMTKPEIDGEECLHDCQSCTVVLPRKWDIDESDTLYGHVKGWDYHVIVATGKSDWVRDVIDEKGSLMEGIGVHGLEIQPTNPQTLESSSKRRRVMLSASNMPTEEHDYDNNGKTSVIVLPAWKHVDGISKNEVAWFMNDIVGSGPSNMDHLQNLPDLDQIQDSTQSAPAPASASADPFSGSQLPSSISNGQPDHPTDTTLTSIPTPDSTITSSIPAGITIKTLHHKALILMCSHKTRDARCGQSAPLLRRELERHLRPLGLYRDLHDDRPGGVGIYFINHVGGHKYSANMMVYRRSGSDVSNHERRGDIDQAVQGIWLARVRPEDCENIVRYTVLQGKVVKPVRQLRGGFDRSCGLASW